MRLGANARMFRSSRASKRSSGRADRPITGADPRLPTFPFCLQKDQKTSDAPPESPMVGSRRLASPRASRLRMHKRKLLIGLATAGLLLAGFGAATMPASAEQRTLLVTLVGGAQVTVTVDVPPGTPTDQIPIPGVSAPILSVQDITPRAARARPAPPAPTQPPVQVQVDPNGGQSSSTPAPASSAPSSTSSSSSDASPGAAQDNSAKPTAEPQAGQQAQQVTTGKLRKAQAPVEAAKKAKDDAEQEGQGRRRQGDGQDAGLTPARRPADARQPDASRWRCPGPAPIGVPELLHRQVPDPAVPAADLPGRRHRSTACRWEVLAAINEIETDYGRNLNVSTAGARRLDAVHALHLEARTASTPTTTAARTPTTRSTRSSPPPATCKAAGGDTGHPPGDLRLQPRRLVRRLRAAARAADRRPARRPRRLAHRPDRRATSRSHAKATLRRRRRRRRRDQARARRAERRASPIESDAEPPRRSTSSPRAGAPVDRRQRRRDRQDRHAPSASARFVVLAGRLRQHATRTRTSARSPRAYPVPKRADGSRSAGHASELEPAAPSDADADRARQRRHAGRDRRRAASAGRAPRRRRAARPRRRRRAAAQGAPVRATRAARTPTTPAASSSCSAPAARRRLRDLRRATSPSVSASTRNDVALKPLQAGRAGHRAARSSAASARPTRSVAPHVRFEIRPAGRGAPRIDPKPILDGWKLLESTAIYRAAGKNPFFGAGRQEPVDRPDPADEQGGARAARAHRPAHRDLRLRPPRHPRRRDRPPRARHARVPRRLAA